MSEQKKDGGPAFPAHPHQKGSDYEKYAGISLRAYIATAALQGILAQGGLGNLQDVADRTRGGGIEVSAAIAFADKLIAELAK